MPLSLMADARSCTSL